MTVVNAGREERPWCSASHTWRRRWRGGDMKPVGSGSFDACSRKGMGANWARAVAHSTGYAWAKRKCNHGRRHRRARASMALACWAKLLLARGRGNGLAGNLGCKKDEARPNGPDGLN
jgi:hypothetical protein